MFGRAATRAAENGLATVEKDGTHMAVPPLVKVRLKATDWQNIADIKFVFQDDATSDPDSSAIGCEPA